MGEIYFKWLCLWSIWLLQMVCPFWENVCFIIVQCGQRSVKVMLALLQYVKKLGGRENVLMNNSYPNQGRFNLPKLHCVHCSDNEILY